MLYLYTDKNRIKLLYLKKTLLGQYENAFFEKTHQIELTKNGQVLNTDFFASAIREAITLVSPNAVKDKDIQLILPQEAFSYLRAEIPPDIADTAIAAFIRDKARAQLALDLDNSYFDYTIQENETGRHILFYAISKDTLKNYNEAFALLNVQLDAIIPETLAYFKLFEKTLRKDKREYIMYANYEKEEVKAYMFDTYGPLEDKKVIEDSTKLTSIEKALKQKGDEYEAAGKKINRLILSGLDSETIRQDTFTKDIGIWTNPLKKIIPEFYQDYLKILVSSPNQPLPFLLYDVCIGAFIFSIENRSFSFFKKTNMTGPNKQRMSLSLPLPKRLPVKEVGIALGSFLVSFLVLYFFFRGNTPGIPKQTTTTVTVSPTQTEPTTTPTPAIDRKTIKLKVLNGSGVKGKASEIKQALLDKGYAEVNTSNADNFDYTITEIQVKKSKTGLADLLQNDLKDSTAKPKMTELEESSSADAVIIFGADFK